MGRLRRGDPPAQTSGLGWNSAARERAGWRSGLFERLRAAGLETIVVRGSLGIVALHVLDDNYLQPQPGTSARDHLASGLIPVGILVGAAAAYPRLRAGARAALAMTFGALGLAIGFPSAYLLLDGSASGDHYTGLLAIGAGAALLLSGPVTLWKARRTGESRRKRYLRRTLATILGAVAALGILAFLVFPIAFSYGYTHLGRTGPLPDVGVPYETVTVTTSDSLELAAAYVPSKNRAAIVVFPGRSALKEARMLARNGYGVLLLDPRGQGGSEGDLVRWAGDRDLSAGARYLQDRPDVDPDRIGGFGSSVGGEILLVAAAQSTEFKAVVSEGAGLPAGEGRDVLRGTERLLLPALYGIKAATAVFANHGPPPPIVDRIGEIAPRSVFLIYTEPGMGGEDVRQPKYFAAAGEPKQLWKVPGAEHTGGIDARPAEYERRVIGFLDRALLEPK
jgi:hypothetical protein